MQPVTDPDSDGSPRQPLLVWLAVAYAAGILASAPLKVTPRIAAIAVGLCAGLLAATTLRSSIIVPWRLVARLALSVALFAAAGCLAGTLAMQSVEDGTLARLARSEPFATVQGVVVTDPTTANGSMSFVLRALEATSPRRLETDELIRVSVMESRQTLRLGDRVELSGRLRLVKNSGPVDYRAQSLKQGIAARFTSYSEMMRRLGPDPGVGRVVFDFRNTTAERIDSAMSPDSASLLHGIMLGDRSRISEEVNDSFRRSGLAHVLAVSGLHVGLLAGVVLGAAALVRLSANLRRMAVIGVVAGYAILTGCHASVLRASLMTGIAILVWLLGRRNEIGATIALVALVLLVYNPLWACDIGAQLSFGAVISIVGLGPRIEPYLRRLPAWAQTGVGATMSSQLGTAPLLAVYFNQLSMIAPAANLAVVPAAGIALATGLAGALIWPILPPVGTLVLTVAGWILSYMVAASHFFAELPLAAVTVGAPSAAQAVTYYAGVWWVLRRRGGGEDRPPRYRTALGIGLATVLLVAAAAGGSCADSPLAPAGRQKLRVTFLDVGQGDATLLRTSHETVLVDGGPSPSMLTRGLANEGVRKIDVLVITHDHADHVAGLQRLAPVVLVGTILAPRHISPRGLAMAAGRFRRRGSRVRLVCAGHSVSFSDGLRLFILSPGRRKIEGSVSDSNNNSVVVRASYGTFAALLPGDMESEGEAALLRQGDEVEADVLKIAHHGSNGATTSRFLRAVRPTIAIISVGKENTFGHPGLRTLRRLRKTRARVYRTDLAGTIEISTDGRSYSLSAAR